MKILIVTPTFPPETGGSATSSWELLQRLPPEIPVKVLTFAQDLTTTPEGVKQIHTVAPIWHRQLDLFLACLKFGRDCDIFFAQEPAVVGFAALLSSKLLGKKCLVKFYGDPVWEEQQRQLETYLPLSDWLKSTESHKDWRSFVARLTIKFGDHVIVPASALGEILKRYYGLPKNRITTLYDPNDIAGSLPNFGNISEPIDSSWRNYSSKLKKLFEELIK